MLTVRTQWLWVFSEMLESVCILPQLILLRQTTVPTVIDSFYLLALGSTPEAKCSFLDLEHVKTARDWIVTAVDTVLRYASQGLGCRRRNNAMRAGEFDASVVRQGLENQCATNFLSKRGFDPV